MRLFKQWDRVKAVREGPDRQCLYGQRYGTVMRVTEDGEWCDVILDGFARSFYHQDQLVEAEPQREMPP